MNWTVYCMGDLPIFRDVINAVAMVFNSSLFNPSQGAGLVLVAMLISLFLFAFPAITGKPLTPFPLIFVFLLYFGGVVPKVTLQVEDIYLGTVTTIDNVPLIVAAPAAIAASIAKGITDNVETAFSTPSQGSYLSLGAEGFVNPLQMLMVFRNMNSISSGGGDVTFFTTDLQQFVSDCAINAPGYSQQAMNTTSDVMAYLGGLPVAGLTTYFDAAHPQGFLVSCFTAQNNLAAYAAALTTSPSSLDKVINSAVPPRNNSTGGVVSLTNAYNNVTAQLLGNSQSAQSFMTNMLANIPVKQGVKCATAATTADLATCNAAYMVQTGIEQENVNAAANASIFAKTAIPMMNILLALFYAFSPIVLGVALMSAAHGLKIIGGYLMFGAWTQSWMPIAAVLNYMVQEQVQYEISKFGASGITLANANDFYSAIAMKVGLASQLMAMTPVISMALLSGSMMALSSVAGKFSQDRGNEKALAPDAMQTDSLTHKGSQLNQAPTVEMSSSTGTGVSDTAVNKNNDVLGNLGEGSATQANLTASNTHAKAASETKDHVLSNAFSNAKKLNKEHGFMQSVSSDATGSFKNEVADARKHVISETNYKALDDADRAAIDASVGLKLAGSGAAASQSLSTVSAKGMKLMENQDDALSSVKSNSFSVSAKRAFEENLKTAVATSLGKDDSDSVKDAINESEIAEEAKQAAESLSHSFSASTSRSTAAVAAQLMDSKGGETGANAALDAAKEKMSAEQRAALEKEEEKMARQVKASGLADSASARVGGRLKAMMNVAGGAGLQVLSDAGLADNPSDNNEFQEGKHALEQEAKPLEDKAQKVDELAGSRLKNTEKNAHAAAHLTGSGGANTANVHGNAAVADREVEQARGAAANGTQDKQMRKEHEQAVINTENQFDTEGYQKGFTDEHGNASMGHNVGRGADQIEHFVEDHPKTSVAVAAVAVVATGGAALALGEASGGAVLLTEATTELGMATEGVATAETAVSAATTAEEIEAAKVSLDAAKALQAAAKIRQAEAAKTALEAAKAAKTAPQLMIMGAGTTAAVGGGTVAAITDDRHDESPASAPSPAPQPAAAVPGGGEEVKHDAPDIIADSGKTITTGIRGNTVDKPTNQA